MIESESQMGSRLAPHAAPEDRGAGEGAAAVVPAGHLSEMFCSLQGEGLFVGERHIFVRTAGCAATCSWCDTVYSKVQTPRFVVHTNAHGEPKPWRPNPVSLGDVLLDVVEMARANAPVSTVSITGGEPLEQPAFVSALARELRARGFRIYLETAGLHAAALSTMIDDLDVIAADVKLPSATGVEHWEAHREFLGAMRGSAFDPARRDARVLFVKVVVDLKASVAEIERAADLVAAVSPRIPFIIQPESDTLLGRRATREDRQALLELIGAGARAASLRLHAVRVIPQTHKVLHIR
jgi:organic radical activating enzyme